MKRWNVLSESKLIYFLAIFLGFLIPDVAVKLEGLLVPVLMLMMTVSLRHVKFSEIKHVDYKTVLNLLAMNYVLLTGFYIFAVKFLINNDAYANGLLILAIMPPAVGIISLSHILKGDTNAGFITEFIAYIAGIVVIPLLSLFIFVEAINPMRIVTVLCLIIIVPFLLSRVLNKAEEKFKETKRFRNGIFVHILYAMSFFIVIGINRDFMIENYMSLFWVLFIIIFQKFWIGSFIYLFLRKRMKKRTDILYVLFGTFKNGGAATAIAIILFGVESTAPLAVHAIVVPLYIIFLEWFILEKYK